MQSLFGHLGSKCPASPHRKHLFCLRIRSLRLGMGIYTLSASRIFHKSGSSEKPLGIKRKETNKNTVGQVYLKKIKGILNRDVFNTKRFNFFKRVLRQNSFYILIHIFRIVKLYNR